MRLNPRSSVLIPLAALPGLVVVLGYFIDWLPLTDLRSIFLRWAVILTAVVLFVGVWNLGSVHWRKIVTGQTGAVYSALLFGSLIITLIITALFGPTAKESLWIFNNFQVPIETSLMAVLVVFLLYIAVRLLSRRMSFFTLVFLGTVLFVMVGMVTLPFLELPQLGEFRSWITQIWAVGGARGILLGIALGTIATGLRVLIGADRPYDGG